MIDRTHKEFSSDDITKIAQTYHNWRSLTLENKEYNDTAGFCKSATVADIKANDYVLTPGRYVGAAALEDDGIAFETKMADLSATLYKQMKESSRLDKAIKKNLNVLGFGE